MQVMKHVYRSEAGEADGGGGEVVGKVDEVAKVDAATEARAMKMGWRPKEEFQGDPEKWRPANEFVERGDNMLPIMRKTAERQERQIAELQQTVREFAELNTKADARAFERALKELKKQQIEAVAAGDAEAFVKVDEAIDDLHKDAAKNPKIKVPEPVEDPDYVEWEGRNKWMKTDKEAQAYAESYAQYLRKKGDERVGSEFLDEVTKAVKKEFPDKFTNPRREAPSSVEGSSPQARKGGKSFVDMPADARAACERMAKNGYADKPKEMADFKANFVKTFFEEN
mgnify:CR=1 FL=1